MQPPAQTTRPWSVRRNVTRRSRLLALASAALTTVGLTIVAPAAADTPPATPGVADNSWCTRGQARDPLAHAPGSFLIGELGDWSGDTPADPHAVTRAARAGLGRDPAVFTYNTRFPFPADGGATEGFLSTVADDVSQRGAVLALTLDLEEATVTPDGTPTVRSSLDSVTPATIAPLVARLRTITAAQGVPVLLRIGPEMNGSWNAWGQKPASFITAFRAIASAVHAVPGVRTIWSPNLGDSGYPWSAGDFPARGADYAALDTDGDGVVSKADDPYAPYWPGADAVDAIGVSLYYFGSKYPWGANRMAPPGFAVGAVRGTPATAGGTRMPDLYATYADGYDKPFMISETGTWWDPNDTTTGLPEIAVKGAWWDQVFAAATDPGVFPRLAAVVFFNVPKNETADVGSATTPARKTLVHWEPWRDDDPSLGSSFVARVPAGAVFASGVPCFAGPAPSVPLVAAPPSYIVPGVHGTSASPPRTVKPTTQCTTHNEHVHRGGKVVVAKVRRCTQVVCATRPVTVVRHGKKVHTTARVCVPYKPSKPRR